MPSKKAGQPGAAAKLDMVNRQLRRWQTRATRANNMVAKLIKTQRRIMMEFDYGPREAVKTLAASFESWPAPTKATERQVTKPVAQEEAVPFVDGGVKVKITKPDDLAMMPSNQKKDIPAFLDRSDPLIAEKMTATRKKAEAAERRKMPLTGREAERHLRREIGKAKAKVKA